MSVEMSNSKRLIAARDLVARGWTWGASTRDAKGRVIHFLSPKAVCFCAGAAWEKVGGDYADLGRLLGEMDIVHWNDAPGRTQAEIVAAFDRAIERERAAA